MTSAYIVSPELKGSLDRWQRFAFGIGLLLVVISIIGAFFNPGQFFRSYLFGYLFWLGLSLGSMAIVMMQYLTGGAWGVVTRRTFESASRVLPLLALLFIPIAVGIPHLYGWSHSNVVHGDEAVAHRSPYMNVDFFLARAALYFSIWLVFAYLLNKWSAAEDERGGQQEKLERLSAPGLILYVFTVTFSTVDWAASLTNDWYSTMWGFLFVAGQGLLAMSFVILMMAVLRRYEPMSDTLQASHFQDLGKLLLMFVMLWAYFAFSQLLIVWSGNLTSEIPWYLPRWNSSWSWVGLTLICIQFLIPFLLLLSEALKRDPKAICGVVGLLIFARFVDLFWTVMPGTGQSGFEIHWLNISVPLALGGIWIGAFLWQIKRRPLLPLQAPNLEQALHHGE